MGIENYFFIVINIIFIYFILKIIREIYNKIIIIKTIKLFAEYMVVLDYHIKRAYEIIYKDKILIYALEGMHVKEEDFNLISQEFVKLVIKLLGPNLYKEFIFFYGNEETLIFNLIEFFNVKYEDDEIRKQSLDNIANKNIYDS